MNEPDFRVAALLALAAVAFTFLGGVRKVFRRPPGPHRYRASLVSGLVLASEGAAIATRPVPGLRMAAAAAILAASLALFLWAARANRDRPLMLAFAATAPEHLQTRGPYAFVRHPFYTSYLLAFLGGLVAAATPWLVPAVALGALTYWRAASREERSFAESPLCDTHREYAARVGMFVPRVFTLRGDR
ncbi:MAG TPA: isoprenylcysteine carboxylmethyltransferase family protein [Anaeromyxobacter sp.]|nr:isoprenylcysteine carboxylmethyltransferase family protein [Anaeromyxobacter sp.]